MLPAAVLPPVQYARRAAHRTRQCAAPQVAKTVAQAAEAFMDGVNFDLEVPLQVGGSTLQDSLH
jgi:hypothetical protein